MDLKTKLVSASTSGVAAICFLMTSPACNAQAIFGTLYGQVVDSAGAAIPGATVTVLDTQKGTQTQVITNDRGEYRVDHLIPDTYQVTASANGFSSVTNKGIRVAADSSPKIDLKLPVGGASASVEVTTEQPQLKTDRADVATTFNEKTVSELPLQNRNFTNLELLIPGSQQLGWSQNSAENPQGSGTIQINGQSFAGVAYELDGAANQDPILGQIVINPPIDSVTEAKIAVQNYDAEFGQAVSAVVTAQTKSGTNALHGGVFDFRKSDAQLARDPFTQSVRNPVTGRFIPSAVYNQFGGTIGGPIRKNRVFFFGDYQGVRQRTGGSARVTVPTNRIRNSCLSGNGCDLSEYLDSSTGRGPQQGQIYNPRALNPVTGEPAPFNNNFIPANLVSPQALAILKLFPAPNASGISNNYSAGGSGKSNNNQFDVRIDAQVTDKIHAFSRYSYFANSLSVPVVFGAAGGQGFSNGNSFGGSANGRNQSAVAGADILVSPKWTTDFRLGYLRYHVATQKYDGTEAFATNVGIPGLNTSNPFTGGAPAFYVDGLSNFGAGLGVNACNCSLLETEDQFQIVNNWTRELKTHAIKFGIDLRYGRNLRVPSDSNRAGELTFGTSDTQNTQGVAAGRLSSPGGVGVATFLLGDVTNFGRYVSSSTNAKEYQKRDFFYVKDNWRITPNLTLDYGIRWEIYFPESVNGKGNGGFADLNTGYFRVAGYGPYNTAMNVQKTFGQVAPRIGVAWQAHPTTVVRAGYGRSYDIGVFGSVFGHVVTQNLPVLAAQSLNYSNVNTSVFNLSQGPPAFTFPTIPASGQIAIPDGLNAKIRQDPNRFPTIDAWNVQVQQQLSKTSSVTIGYVGNKGTHTFAGDDKSTNANQSANCLNAAQSSTGQRLCWGQTFNRNLLRPYYASRGWTQDLTFYHNGFDTHYNSLQVTAEKRFAQGLQFSANYAWQRAYNFGGDYVEIDRKVSFGRSDSLRNQQFTFFSNYDLPFGRTALLGSTAPSAVKYVIGGWSLGTSLNWASGLPFTPSYGECGSDIASGPCRPDALGPQLRLKLSKFDPVTQTRTYFTPVAQFGANGSASGIFRRPQVATFGNIGRNPYNGPQFFNTDFSIMKNFTVYERMSGQFRMDAFNAFNHINAGGLANACIDCTVGNYAGLISGQAIGASPRQLQFAVRLNF